MEKKIAKANQKRAPVRSLDIEVRQSIGSETKKIFTTKSATNHRGAEFTEIGVFLDQGLFTLRPQCLRGELSETFVLLYQARLLGNLFNRLVLFTHLRDEFFRRSIVLDHAERSQLRDNAGFLHCLFDGRNQSRGDFFGYARRSKERVPNSKDVLAVAELGQHWNLREMRILNRYNEPPDLPALQMAAKSTDGQ